MALTQTHQLWLYWVLVVGIIVLPGMDMAYVLGASLVGGRRAGAAAVLGVVAGGVVHMAVAALGIGLVLMAAPGLFNGLLLAGAAYMAWVGGSMMLNASSFVELRTAPLRSPHRIFVRALATCLLNPKAYVFTLAVVPNFLRAEYGSMVLQGLLMTLITAATQVLVYSAVALVANHMRGWLMNHGAAEIALSRTVGLVLVAMAVWAAWEGLRNATWPR